MTFKRGDLCKVAVPDAKRYLRDENHKILCDYTELFPPGSIVEVLSCSGSMSWDECFVWVPTRQCFAMFDNRHLEKVK